jgi:hypothetical protein
MKLSPFAGTLARYNKKRRGCLFHNYKVATVVYIITKQPLIYFLTFVVSL